MLSPRIFKRIQPMLFSAMRRYTIHTLKTKTAAGLGKGHINVMYVSLGFFLPFYLPAYRSLQYINQNKAAGGRKMKYGFT